MSSPPPPPTPEFSTVLPAAAPVPATVPPGMRTATVSRAAMFLLALLAAAALLSSVMLWQRLSSIQEQLARQSADTGANAIEARALARQAQDVARDAATRQALMEQRIAEVAVQRGQIEELMQSVTRTRDENLLVDIESALRIAQQQTQLTGSPEPLLAALTAADERLARAGQPRVARVRAAIGRDIERLRSVSVTDVTGLLARLDEVVRQIDDLPLANAVPARALSEAPPRSQAGGGDGTWWQRWRDSVLEDARSLVRVSRIDAPEAALVAPEQAFFLRENLKLKVLNARLSLIARQNDVARAEVASAAETLAKYFDASSRRTQAVASQLQQVQAQVRSGELPRADQTFAVLAAVSGGK